ncbi:restriction endonuclease subunit S [Heyndrickxia sporothermodurans]|uniref:restriction endonuclease subunit S n=1 Tax=Heyndrickxia sporothermodurans TaxID=46224 RepID=UPI0035D692E2
MVQHEINLPEGWVLKQIKDVAPLQRGFDLPASKVVSGKYPVCYSNGIANYHNEFKAEGPGVFTGRSGTIGNVFYVKENYWPHNTSLWVTDFKGNDRKFVYYLYQQVKLDRFNAGTGVPTLNRNDVHVHKIPIPKSAVEQQKIASILSTWDKAIELKEKLIEQKKEQKKGLMQRLLTGEVRLPGFEGEWREVKLGKIGKTYNGLSGKTAEDCPRTLTTRTHNKIRRKGSF